MRITNGMVAANTLRNINKAANRLAAANAAVASNQKIQRASDDPVIAARAVTYRSYVSQIKQYQDNTEAADGWQTATDDALTELSDLITTVKTLTNEASSDTCSEANRESIKTRIETLRDQAVTLMNSTYAGRYIFGGYSTDEAPYEVVSTDIGDTVKYKGDYLSLGGVVSADISDDDIKAFYNSNSNSVYNSLSDAAASALNAYTAAQAAADADPANTTLADKAAAAKETSDTLALAADIYGDSSNLTMTAAAAKNDYNVLKNAVDTYAGTTTLSDAASAAQSDYTAAQAAADADPTNTTLADKAATAKETVDTLAMAVSAYGGDMTLTDTAAAAKNVSNTLASAAANTDQDINYNIGFNSEVTVNIEGQDVTGEDTGNNLFDTFSKLLLALDGDTSYKKTGLDSSGNVTVTTEPLDLSDLIDELDTDLSRVTVAQATLGARMNTVSDVSKSLGDAYTAYSTLMSDNENIGTAEAATELSSAEYTYEAALSVGAKAISKTLIDYIG